MVSRLAIDRLHRNLLATEHSTQHSIFVIWSQLPLSLSLCLSLVLFVFRCIFFYRLVSSLVPLPLPFFLPTQERT